VKVGRRELLNAVHEVVAGEVAVDVDVELVAVGGDEGDGEGGEADGDEAPELTEVCPVAGGEVAPEGPGGEQGGESDAEDEASVDIDPEEHERGQPVDGFAVAFREADEQLSPEQGEEPTEDVGAGKEVHLRAGRGEHGEASGDEDVATAA